MAGPPEFRYLRAGPGRAKSEVLERNYRPADLLGRLVIHDRARHRFHVFRDWADFRTWRKSKEKGDRCFDEVVFGWHPQRLKFDIDAPGHKIDAIPEEVALDFAGREPPPTPDAELESYVADLLDLPVPPPAVTPAERRQAKVDAIMQGLIDVILDELEGSYFGLDSIHATRDDLVTLESSGRVGTDYRYSYHILVVPYAVANNEEAKEFTSRVCAQLPAEVRELVDPRVNMSIQNFRLSGSTKPGSVRVKKVTARFGTSRPPNERTRVCVEPGTRVLTRLVTECTKDGRVRLLDEPRADNLHMPDMSAQDLGAVQALIRKSGLAGHRYLKTHGNLLIFRRERPSFCAICSRVHDHDNTLMLSVTPGPLGRPALSPDAAEVPHLVTEHCRRAVGGKTRALGSVNLKRRKPYDLAPAKAGAAERRRLTAGTVRDRTAAIKRGEVNVHRANSTELEALPDRLVYSENKMREYQGVPTLAVKAQMKLGKTQALRGYLDKEFPVVSGGLRPPVIRMVTFRQTFSKSMQKECFPEFALYSDHKGDLDCTRYPRLIVQVESLHRLRMGEAPEPVDLLILDEVESILAQFNSGLHKRRNASFAMFQWMLGTARRVVCMDANIGDRTLHTLQKMRPKYPVTFHWNQYKRAAEDRYHFSADISQWLDRLFAKLASGKRIVLPTNSLKEACAFEAAVTRRFPDKRVRLYSSRTLASEKESHFADVHAYWSNLDVLIYTPTVSAGVSYELEHFDVLFGYFTDMSCDVETCRQMLARVRNIKTKDHYICLSGRPNNLPTAVEDLRRLVMNKRTNLYRRLGDQTALSYDYSPSGELRCYDSPYFCLWLETLRVEHLSRNNFVARFIDQVADTGAAVACLDQLPGAEGRLEDIRRGQKALKLDLADRECRAVAAAPELNADEAAEIRERLSRQQDVSLDERLSLTKHRLRESYHWHGRDLDHTFVEKYHKPGVRRIYKNLLRITAGPSLLESLRQIQKQEAGNHRILMNAKAAAAGPDSSEWESRDLHQIYVFQSHYLAVWLLHLCGFLCLTDTSLIREETMYYGMRARERVLFGYLEQISYEFQLRVPNAASIAHEVDLTTYVTKVLRVVNAVLRRMYGLEVRRTPKRTGAKNLYLARTRAGRLFTLGGRGGSAAPHIPSGLAAVGTTKRAALNAFLDDCFYGVDPRS